jgi:hypothetical protein
LVDIGATDVVEEGEDSDDDVGPMPMPAGADGAPTKKRKGERKVLIPTFASELATNAVISICSSQT